MGKHALTQCSARLSRAGWQRKDSHNMHSTTHIGTYEEEPAA